VKSKYITSVESIEPANTECYGTIAGKWIIYISK